jgi:signal transduction histidine kinase
MSATNRSDTEADLGTRLARELHDGVADELQAMLVELELLRRRDGVPEEIEEFPNTIHHALACLRHVIRELRDQGAQSRACRD